MNLPPRCEKCTKLRVWCAVDPECPGRSRPGGPDYVPPIREAKPWPQEEQPDGTEVAVDPVDMAPGAGPAPFVEIKPVEGPPHCVNCGAPADPRCVCPNGRKEAARIVEITPRGECKRRGECGCADVDKPECLYWRPASAPLLQPGQQPHEGLSGALIQFLLASRPVGELRGKHLHAYLRGRSVEVPTWLADRVPETSDAIGLGDMAQAIWEAFSCGS